jgi:N-acetylglutamate synthase-like GNAT family acetyltransferase
MIRKYSNTDKLAVIELLKQNTPKYFDFSEEKGFENYLDNEVEDYFVYQESSEIMGAGGINYFPNEKTARISWDMVAPAAQGKGIGTILTEYRLMYLKENLNVEQIIVRTTQLAYPFYEKLGFELERIESKFWSENFDLYQMKIINKN